MFDSGCKRQQNDNNAANLKQGSSQWITKRTVCHTKHRMGYLVSLVFQNKDRS